MKKSIQEKLKTLVDRHQGLGKMLSDPKIIADQTKFRDYSKEYAHLEPIVTVFIAFLNTQQQKEHCQTLLKDEDPEMRALAEEELKEAQDESERLEKELEVLLIPEDPDDERSAYLEVRAGTGGNEAAIFAGDLFRMYSRYAEEKYWKLEVVSVSEGEHGGFKEIISKISGKNVYGHLKFESGVHRVQRVPETESQGRIHTSACTVAVLPEVEEIDAIEIKTEELRIDTFRSSGAGGQHVNVTDSAVRITHIPTGVVVECQDERSQHKNKAKAMSLLQSRLLAAQKQKQREERAATRRDLVGSGDRSERIRTYNYPQGRVTDHRINLTLYKLAQIMEGELEQLIQPLRREYQADQLAAMGEE